ncbi:MAG: glycosyltransferase family 87 protein [Anaerolineaceae bacterium]
MVKTKHTLPFQNMAPGAWVNLVLVVMALFYLLQIISDQMKSKLCINLAVDYCTYWTVGRLSTTHGYASIYDQTLIYQSESVFFTSGDAQSIKDRTIPFVYLPVFVFPFQILSFLDLRTSFIVWTLINIAGAFLYLRFFARSMTGSPPPMRLLFMSILSIPFFNNLFGGQTNLLLMISIGEFIRANVTGKPLRAGLWLGGLLLKPLFLILILPFLLLHRSYKTLISFSLVAVITLILSFAMIGATGFQALFQVYLDSAQGGSASMPIIMMNWRMLGVHLTGFVSATLGRAVVIIGTSLTLIATWFITRKSYLPDQFKSILAFLGILAATGAVTWHAHAPQTVMFLPLFVYLSLKSRSAERIFKIWVFSPVFFNIANLILAITTHFAPWVSTLILLQTGVPALILNLVILIWAVFECRRGKTPDQIPVPVAG